MLLMAKIKLKLVVGFLAYFSHTSLTTLSVIKIHNISQNSSHISIFSFYIYVAIQKYFFQP